MFNKTIIRTISITIFILVLVFLLIIVEKGFLAIRNKGISAIAYNTELFTNEEGYTLDDCYIISIDLSDLNSCIGTRLYDDGLNIIEIDTIEESGNYIICFKTYGSYDYNNATLVSAIKHDTSSENIYSVETISNVLAFYKGETTSCRMRRIGGLNYDDGADFELYVFPSDEYANEYVHNDDYGIVEITFRKLYFNKWKRR
jgi:hypothetical protein